MTEKQESLPKGWRWTTLGDALKWGSGGTPLKGKPEYYGGDIPWVVIGDLNDGLVTETQTKITELGFKNSSTKWVDEGSILLAMYGSIGKLGIAGMKLTTNQAIAFTKPEVVSTKYLFYYLMSKRKELLNLGAGATQQNISQTVIKAFPFPIAPQDEQERIVTKIEELFTQLDAGTAALRRVQAGLKRYKASVLKAACEGRLVPQDPSDEPAEELLRRLGKKPLEGEDLPPLPKGWCWAKVGEISETTSGGTPSRSHSEYYRGNIPWVKSGELKDGIITNIEESITDEGLKNSSAKIFPKGTVVVALYGATVGRTGILGIDASTNQAVCAIFPYGDSFFPKYMFYWLQSKRQDLINMSVGGAQPNISQGIIRVLDFPLPPIPEQRRIVAEVERRLSVANEIEQVVAAALARSARLRQSILKRAFEGRL